ncbi:MAG: ABC transporter permease [Planctomycetales bacterium]|nr:ABC transporter permease [Planctomycetales bacterium]
MTAAPPTPSVAFRRETLAQLARWFHHLRREPFNVVFTLTQPILWMLFFSSLMQEAKLPGMAPGTPYRDFMTAGVLTFTVYGNAMSGGIPLLFDRENGFLTRLLATPIARSSIVAGRFLYIEAVALAQTLLILGLAALLGVSVRTGVLGVLGIVLFGALLGLGLTALSLALAMWVRHHGTFFMLLGTLGLPLLFCSTALAPVDAMPTWMRWVALANPMSFCVDAMRPLVLGGGSFGRYVLSAAGLLAFDAVAVWVSVRVLKGKLA